MPSFRARAARRVRLALAVVAFMGGFASSPSIRAQSVEFFSPQGEIKSVRQVTARFARPMVPFGDPREVDPFGIDCPEKGKGRWADMKNWAYDFDHDLPAGVRCSFTLKPGLTALDGSALVPGARFEFTTG